MAMPEDFNINVYIVAHIRQKCKKNNKKVEKYNKTKKGYRNEPLFSAKGRKRNIK